MTWTPLRGQCVVREVFETSKSIWTPTPNPFDRDQKTHRGVVLALGPPSLVKGREVPWGFSVGDTVLYHWEHNEKGSTADWGDVKDAKWLMQREVDGVVE
jgi:co-chaperonin GroES (HSP10)